MVGKPFVATGAEVYAHSSSPRWHVRKRLLVPSASRPHALAQAKRASTCRKVVAPRLPSAVAASQATMQRA